MNLIDNLDAKAEKLGVKRQNVITGKSGKRNSFAMGTADCATVKGLFVAREELAAEAAKMPCPGCAVQSGTAHEEGCPVAAGTLKAPPLKQELSRDEMHAVVRQNLSRLFLQARGTIKDQLDMYQANDESEGAERPDDEALLAMIRGMPKANDVVLRACILQAKHARRSGVVLTPVQERIVALCKSAYSRYWPCKTTRQCTDMIRAFIKLLDDFETLARVEMTPLVLVDTVDICGGLLKMSPEKLAELKELSANAAVVNDIEATA